MLSNLPQITQLESGWVRRGTQVCLIEILLFPAASMVHSKSHRFHLNSRYVFASIYKEDETPSTSFRPSLNRTSILFRSSWNNLFTINPPRHLKEISQRYSLDGHFLSVEDWELWHQLWNEEASPRVGPFICLLNPPKGNCSFENPFPPPPSHPYPPVAEGRGTEMAFSSQILLMLKHYLGLLFP